MDVKLKPFDFAQATARAGLRTDGLPLRTPAPTEPQASFRTAMSDALRGVSRLQLESIEMD